jgi:hypothetical protein
MERSPYGSSIHIKLLQTHAVGNFDFGGIQRLLSRSRFFYFLVTEGWKAGAAQNQLFLMHPNKENSDA